MQLPISFVQDEPADSTEGDAQGVFDMIHQTSRSGHQDVDSFTEPEDRNQCLINSKIKRPDLFYFIDGDMSFL